MDKIPTNMVSESTFKLRELRQKIIRPCTIRGLNGELEESVEVVYKSKFQYSVLMHNTYFGKWSDWTDVEIVQEEINECVNSES